MKGPAVFIIDDDVDYVDSLSALVSAMGFEPQKFNSPVDFLQQFDAEAPGVILVDERMPLMSGLCLLEKLCSEPLRPAVIFLTGYADIRAALKALRHGAFDYLQKGCSEAELYEAIQRGLAHDAAQRAATARKREVAARFAKLSQPEREVLSHVLQGLVNKQIAALLGISRRTVEDRRARIAHKLGVESFAELVALATSAGFYHDTPSISSKTGHGTTSRETA